MHSSTVVPFNYHPSIPLLLHFILCFVSTKICCTLAVVDSSVACALNVGTGAPLFKVSPWALKLWQWRTRQAFSHLHPSHPSPNAPHPHLVKISLALPQWETEGKRDLEERGESTTTTAASKSQQPGEGEWVIFYGWWGTVDVHLFIFTVSTGVCLCVYMSVCVFETRSVISPFFSYQKRPELTSPPFPALPCNAAAICVAKWWICKQNINLFGPKIIMNVWVLEKSYWAGRILFTSLFTPFMGPTSLRV